MPLERGTPLEVRRDQPFGVEWCRPPLKRVGTLRSPRCGMTDYQSTELAALREID